MSSPEGSGLFGFPKEARLRKRPEFLNVQSRGVRLHTRHFVVYIAGGRAPGARIGITASKKVGNAVVRNRWKRSVREGFRLLGWRSQKQGLDLVVIARKGMEPPSPAEAKDEIRGAVRKYRKRRER